MAAATATALLIGGGAFAASNQIMAGQAQSKALKQQGNYNAEVYAQQAEVLKDQKRISETQFNRSAAFARGKIVAGAAGKGLMMSGSPMAILADTESQLQFDQAIEQYNLDVNKGFAESAAKNARYSAAVNSRLASYTGYTNAFQTALSTGTNAYLVGKL